LWFILIALSPVLTYQHHLVDIAGGFVLGAGSLFLFRRDRLFSPRLPNDLHNRASQP
jgi:membrane-associated phospholipid phosphatase